MSEDASPFNRACHRCGDPLHACMGFVAAGDFLAMLEAQRQGRLPPPRELCGRCVLLETDMLNLKSFIRGIRAMHRDRDRASVNIRLEFRRTRFWLVLWTPKWHEGRGPYISIGFGLGAFYRGY